MKKSNHFCLEILDKKNTNQLIEEKIILIFKNLQNRKTFTRTWLKTKQEEISTIHIYKYSINILDVSECWGEYNYVRSSVKPIVFTHLEEESNQLHYSLYLTETFNPADLKKDDQGLLYHKVSLNDIGYGIFSTDVSMMLSKYIRIDGNSMYLEWKGKVYEILNIPEKEAARFDEQKN